MHIGSKDELEILKDINGIIIKQIQSNVAFLLLVCFSDTQCIDFNNLVIIQNN